jgi:hypothetical protein
MAKVGTRQAEKGSRLVESITQPVQATVHGDEVEEITMLAGGGVGLMFNCT